MQINKTIKSLRCIHRHTIDEHPQCFAKGLLKYPNDRLFERYSGENWYKYPGFKIGYFDIETDNLYADFGTMLSWCIKEKDGDIKYSLITKDEIFREENVDYRLVKEFINIVKDYKIIVGYNSTNFDLPFLRAKALRYGLEFPGFSIKEKSNGTFENSSDMYHFDLYYTVKSKLRISRKSLDNACDYLKIVGKTPINKDTWRKAKYGNKDALLEVLDHNMGDVVILEKLHDKLEFSRKWIRTPI